MKDILDENNKVFLLDFSVFRDLFNELLFQIIGNGQDYVESK